MNKYILLILAIGLLAFSGCMGKLCDKTTDCGSDEICKDGFCAKLSEQQCRTEDQTCDIPADCCQGLTCDGNKCKMPTCPASCDDNYSCTQDSCNATSGSCVHTLIQPCCGNGMCEQGEDCGDCLNDCPCTTGLVCGHGVCMDEITAELYSITENSSVESCRQEVFNAWTLGKNDEIITLSENCSAGISRAIGQVQTLKSGRDLSDEQRDAIDSERLVLESEREELYFMKGMAETDKNKETMDEEEYDNLMYLEDIKDALSHLESAIYKLYTIKNDYADQWDDTHEALFTAYAERYRGVNQQINALYDEMGSYDYKYAFQVDPNDPVVIEIADATTAAYAVEDVPQALLEKVYLSVQYVSDPDWQTDWVQPPAYTLMTGKGDCDDSAVLLASLFRRAGVEETNLCEVDTNGDDEYDHLTVGVERDGGTFLIYESVWSPGDYLPLDEDGNAPLLPRPVPQADYPGRIMYCYKSEEVITSALADKCDDGTLYGQCSEDPPWFCDNGEMIADCITCGCDQEYPNCAKTGDDKGLCIVCFDNGEWIDEYAVCCPEGYDRYNPYTELCRKD
ncbi:MAG: transglutaminase family protein [Candidatus ainarchaeum sp.]|nr:transglutaminase family protein [Candidatus ainarchaeum sp.]